MFHHGKIRRSTPQKRTLAQRIVAFLLSLLVIVIVLDPLWECHDHLDDIRHLGAHGILLILLIVLCAGISLLKSSSIAPPFLSSIIIPGIKSGSPLAGSFDHFAGLVSAAAPGSAALPLRI